MGAGWSEDQPPPSQSQSLPQPSRPQTAGNAAPISSDFAANSVQTSPEQKSKPVREKAAEVKLPHAFESIVKAADSPIDRFSTEKLYDQLCAGIFLNNRTKKYWVEKKSNSNCFMLFARALSITWAEDSKYWKWNRMELEEARSNPIEVAELQNVCWLEVQGKIKTAELSPGTCYQVAFVVMIKDPAYGWEVPVNIRLTLPDGTKQERKENLIQKPKGQWVEIAAGDFVVQRDKLGEVEFSIYEYQGGMWKKGLLLKGVLIRPKN